MNTKINNTDFKNLKTIKLKVLYLLENYPEIRDSDDRLISTYYLNEIGIDESKQISGYALLKDIYYSKLPNSESIKRTRMMIQKTRLDLRTENYAKRVRRKLPTFIVRNKD